MRSEVRFCTDYLIHFPVPYTTIHKNQLTDVDLTLFKKQLELHSGRAALQERTNKKIIKCTLLILKSLATVVLSN